MKVNRAEEISKKGLTFNPCCAIIMAQRKPIASCFSFLMGFRVFPCFFPEATIYLRKMLYNSKIVCYNHNNKGCC